MRTTYDREAVDQLARAVLAGRLLNEEAGIDARAELEQFDMVARAFHSDARPGRRAGSRREPLAFGVEGLTAAVTALVLAVAVETLGKLVQERTDRSADRLASWIRRVILRRPEPSPEPSPDPSPEGPSGAGGPDGSREDGPALTPVQMQLIHRAARRHARRMNVPERTAEAVADGIVAELAMARTAPGPSADPGTGGGDRATPPGAGPGTAPGGGTGVAPDVSTDVSTGAGTGADSGPGPEAVPGPGPEAVPGTDPAGDGRAGSAPDGGSSGTGGAAQRDGGRRGGGGSAPEDDPERGEPAA